MVHVVHTCSVVYRASYMIGAGGGGYFLGNKAALSVNLNIHIQLAPT
jgi:hypothetical protein